jgi:hypothetical protein
MNDKQKFNQNALDPILIEKGMSFIEHAGVKGMKWGVRKKTPTGASRSINKKAKKDAQEFARAKMFYGEGAGVRRKLVKATVDQRSKNSSEYKKAFDFHLKSQDMSKHAGKAKKERKSKDRNAKNAQRIKAVARRATGEMGTQAAFVAIAAGGIAFLRSEKGQKIMAQTVDFGSKLVRNT